MSAGEPHAEPRTLVIVPTYNESENIPSLIEEVMALPGDYHVLVVDDNSPDGTAEIVRGKMAVYPQRLHMLEREGKLGLGTAYIAGFQFALERDYTFVCEMDADFSHDPNDLPRLIEAVRNGADLAIGSRYIGGTRVVDWPLSRLILSYGAGVYTRAVTRMPIRDVTAGFKCFHRRVLESVPTDRIRSNGYSFQVEMHFRVWKLGFKIEEVPIVFTERAEGKSKMTRAIIWEAAGIVWELRIRDLFRRL